MHKTLITTLVALVSMFTAQADQTIYNTLESNWKQSYEYTPGTIYPLTNIGHNAFTVATSCDDRYIFTSNASGAAVLDSRSMRIIKSFRDLKGTIIPHPTNPDLIYIGRSFYFDYDKEPCECLLVNWRTGETVMHRRSAPELLSSSDQQFLWEKGEDSWMPVYNNRSTFAGWGYSRFYTGSIAVDSKDSLMVITGTNPLIFDLKNGVIRASLPYRQWLAGALARRHPRPLQIRSGKSHENPAAKKLVGHAGTCFQQHLRLPGTFHAAGYRRDGGLRPADY